MYPLQDKLLFIREGQMYRFIYKYKFYIFTTFMLQVFNNQLNRSQINSKTLTTSLINVN